MKKKIKLRWYPPDGAISPVLFVGKRKDEYRNFKKVGGRSQCLVERSIQVL